MPTYRVTDPSTGRTLKLTGDSPPTEQELIEVFGNGMNQQSSKMPPATSQIMSSEQPTPGWAGRNPNLYGLYGAGRELYKTVGKPAIETAGMIGGGIIGAGSGFLGGLGIGAVPGAAAGAGLGYAGARNLTGVLDSAFELERGQRKPTLPQVAKENVKDIALGSIGTGTPAQSMLQRELMLGRKTGSQAISEAMLKETGLDLTAGERTGHKTLAQIESLLEQVPFSSDIIQNWREAKQLKPLIEQRNKYIQSGDINTPQGEELGRQIKEAIDKRLGQFNLAKTDASNKLRDDILKKLGSSESYEALSKEGQELLKNKSVAAVAKKNELYQAVSESMPQGELTFKNYNDTAQNALTEVSSLATPDQELIKILKWGTKTEKDPAKQAVIDNINEVSKGMPPQYRAQMLKQAGLTEADMAPVFTKNWKTMQAHRAELTDYIKRHDEAIKQNAPNLKGQLDSSGKVAKDLVKALDADFDQIAKSTGGEVLNKYKLAQAFYSNEYAPIWKNKIIRSMAYKNPSEVIDVAIKKGSTTEVDLVKKAMGQADFDKTIKPAFTNKLLGAGKDAPFDPQALQKRIAEYGDETLLKVYTPTELNALKDIAKTGKLILDKKLPNTSLLKSIASRTDNVIVNSILGAEERGLGSTTVLQNITALDPYLTATQQEGLKIEFLKRVFKTSETTGAVEPLMMAKNISRDEAILKKYFNQSGLDGLRKISAIGKQMSKAQQMAANPSGTAKNVIAWGVANQLIFSPIEPLTRGDVRESGKRVGLGLVTAILAPKTLAKLYLNPKTRQLLIQGMATPQNTKKGMDIAKQLSIVIGNEQMSDE